VRRDLAHEFGCDTNEIAITRNASESMEILIFGIDLKPGDEVIITDQNYPRMVTSWEQRARRDRIVVKKISFPIPLPSSSALIDRVSQAISPKTKVIELPHITNFSGQILPIRELVRLGHKKGIEVRLWTPIGQDATSGGIGLVQIDGIDSVKLAEYLWDRQRIVVIPIKHEQFEGIRVTPNVYSTLDEVDVFVDAMKLAVARGV
jgi:selenocysteine lyase/cysteine desulfurase